MNVQQMRVRLAEVYPGKGWQTRLKAMSDNQVIAIYRRLQKEGIIK